MCPQALRKDPEDCNKCLWGAQAQPPCIPLCPTDYTSLDSDTGDTTVLPESIVMGERQPEHELSTTQEEPVVVPVVPPVPWRAVILRRVLAAAAAISVLLVGILVRLLTGNG